jgi:DNA-binding response OmpR family regulator
MKTLAMEKSALRIVVLDDDPFLGKLIHSFLHKYGYTNSVLVEDEAACIRLTQQDRVLVILDYDLKSLKGLEVMSQVQSNNPSSSFIFFSAQQSAYVRSQIFASGALTYVQKDGSHSFIELGQALNEYVTNWCDEERNTPIDLIDFRSRLNRA